MGQDLIRHQKKQSNIKHLAMAQKSVASHSEGHAGQFVAS